MSPISEASADLLAWDRDHLWHPYTSMAAPDRVRLVTGAAGARLRVDDREVVDGMSSWWAAIHGYRHPVLDEAARAQLASMSHVMFGGLTHEPAVRLARQLVQITPDGLEHVFLADSGSVSVEVALKMAMQYQRGRGRADRTRMLTVRGGYHGDTCGCMGVCDPDGGMHAIWRGFLPEHRFAPRPPSMRGTSASYDARVGVDEHAAAVAAWTTAFEQTAHEHVDELAGIVVEPLLQGAGGMHAYDPDCLRAMRRVADELDLVLVADEIATGFGRTGTMFACEAAGIRPDVLCLGKALTGGYLTLAATLCTPTVAHAISRSEAGVLMHGPTYMGNPLACAVASASVELLVSRDWAGTVARVGAGLRSGLADCTALRSVADVRTLGAVGVVELTHPVDGTKATEAALAEGVWLRPFRNLVYTMPPYVASAEEVAAICHGVRAAVEAG